MQPGAAKRRVLGEASHKAAYSDVSAPRNCAGRIAMLRNLEKAGNPTRNTPPALGCGYPPGTFTDWREMSITDARWREQSTEVCTYVQTKANPTACCTIIPVPTPAPPPFRSGMAQLGQAGDSGLRSIAARLPLRLAHFPTRRPKPCVSYLVSHSPCRRLVMEGREGRRY
jgi:hypothetical protein